MSIGGDVIGATLWLDPDLTRPDTLPATKLNEQVRSSEETRANIIELARILGREKEALAAISAGKSYAEFSREMAELNAKSEIKTVNIISKRDNSACFSLANVIKSAVDRNVDLSREMEQIGRAHV